MLEITEAPAPVRRRIYKALRGLLEKPPVKPVARRSKTKAKTRT